MGGTTTIQVSTDVLELLKQVRKEEDATSYNDVLRKMLAKAKRCPSFAGVLGPVKSMKEILKGLRDEEY